MLTKNKEKTTAKSSKHNLAKINMNVLKLWTKLKLKCVKLTVKPSRKRLRFLKKLLKNFK